MKRLVTKNKKLRLKVNFIKTKISNYLEDCLPRTSVTKFSNICVFSSYSKVIYKKYHMSGKCLKFFFREGLIFGINKKSF